MKKNYIDYLRVAATLAVIVIHVTSGWYVKIGEIDQASWWLANILNAASRFSVPVFVMISGALLLEKTITPAEFYKKRALRLVPPIIFWTIVYTLFRLYLGMDTAGLIRLLKIDLWVEGNAYVHLWYLSMFACLMLFVPFINKFLLGEQPTKNDLVVVLVIFTFFFILNTVSDTAREVNGIYMYWHMLFQWYIGYLVMGYAIDKYGDSMVVRNSALIGLIFLITCTGAWLNYYTAHTLGIVKDYFVLNDKGILVFLLSFFVFLLAKRSDSFLKQSDIISKIAVNSFGIYLIHPMILNRISAIVVKYSLPDYIYIPLVFSTTLFLSYFSISAMKKTSLFRRVC